MNILLTTNCNRRECLFCFEQSVPEIKARQAAKSLGDGVLPDLGSPKPDFISEHNYAYLLRLAKAWGVPRICLLGGEPTQHRMIARFVADALQLGQQVMVATNGVIHSPRSDELQSILYSAEGRNLLFLLNPYLRPHQPSAELAAIKQNLAWMQAACTLAVSVWNDDFDLAPYFELISRFHLNTMIRVSLAHPMLDRPNRFAAALDYQRIGAALKRQGRALRERGIRLFCDCGFVACMFASAPGGAAIRQGVADLVDCGILFQSICNPLPDIHPDLTASHCLPLASGIRLQMDPAHSVDRHATMRVLGGHFQSQATRFLFPQCETCDLRLSGDCIAGCLAHRLRLSEGS